MYNALCSMQCTILLAKTTAAQNEAAQAAFCGSCFYNDYIICNVNITPEQHINKILEIYTIVDNCRQLLSMKIVIEYQELSNRHKLVNVRGSGCSNNSNQD